MTRKDKNKKGFTLVELIVSIGVFTIVMFISLGSVLSVMDANRKAQALRSVMDNLNYSLESMTRTIMFGRNYHCDINVLPINSVNDCSSGANSLAITNYSGLQVVYKLVNGRIIRSIGGGTDYYLTGADVVIDNLSFRVFGSGQYSDGADMLQPQIIIVIKGHAGTKVGLQSYFTIETTVSQRFFDS